MNISDLEDEKSSSELFEIRKVIRPRGREEFIRTLRNGSLLFQVEER